MIKRRQYSAMMENSMKQREIKLQFLMQLQLTAIYYHH